MATAHMEAMADRGVIENYFKLLRLYRDKCLPLKIVPTVTQDFTLATLT